MRSKRAENTKQNFVRPVIAIVDDDPSVRKAIASLCDSVGYEVHAFETAEEFLQSDSGLTSDCLVLDLQLPGMSGLELLQELEKNLQTIPVVMVTGSLEPNLENRAMEAGAFAFLRKAQDDDRLLDEIQRAIER